MSCELQKFRKGYIEKDIPMKQFDLDDNNSSFYYDYEEQQNGIETADQSILLDNFNDYSIETSEKIIFIYPPSLKKNNLASVFNQRNVAQAMRLCFEKQGQLIYKKQDVFCVVENKQFTVKSVKESKEIIICIRFDIFPSSVKIVYNSFGRALFLRLQILTPKQLDYDFYHEDSNEIQSWFKDLNYQILAQQDQINLRLEYSLIESFQKKIFITESEFLADADSLDLVFFVGKSIGSKITRIVSQSEYDHVALVLRGANDQIFFFEAGQNHGVSIYTWEKFKNYNWRDFYKQKLNCVRTNTMISDLEKFVKSAVGQIYELSFSKLFKKNSFINQVESEQGRTYFCSELIAAAYKRMGLLPKDISSAQYWPKNFSQQGQIQLQIENSSLSEEKIIYF